MAHNKSGVTLLTLIVPNRYWLDLSNEVHNVSELQLVPKWQADKFERLKKTIVLLLKRTFFSNVQLWRLVFLDPVGVQRHTVPHFKGLLKLDWNQKRPRAWQHFYPPPRPLEKGHFIRQNLKKSSFFERHCRCKMAFFYWAWQKVKVLSRHRSLLIPIKLD